MSTRYEREYDIVHRIFSISGKDIAKLVVGRLTGEIPDGPTPKVIKIKKNNPVVMTNKEEVIDNIIEAVRAIVIADKDILATDEIIKRHIDDDHLKDADTINKVLLGCIQDYTVMMYYKISETIEQTFVEYIG